MKGNHIPQTVVIFYSSLSTPDTHTTQSMLVPRNADSHKVITIRHHRCRLRLLLGHSDSATPATRRLRVLAAHTQPAHTHHHVWNRTAKHITHSR